MRQDEAIARRTDVLFREHWRGIGRRTDRAFAGLLAFQWIAGVLAALSYSPLAWAGTASRTHFFVWVAIGLGGRSSARRSPWP